MPNKTKVYSVDVPPPNPFSHPTWTNVIDFETPEKALAYVKKYYNADDQGRVCLVKVVEK